MRDAILLALIVVGILLVAGTVADLLVWLDDRGKDDHR